MGTQTCHIQRQNTHLYSTCMLTNIIHRRILVIQHMLFKLHTKNKNAAHNCVWNSYEIDTNLPFVVYWLVQWIMMNGLIVGTSPRSRCTEADVWKNENKIKKLNLITQGLSYFQAKQAKYLHLFEDNWIYLENIIFC